MLQLLYQRESFQVLLRIPTKISRCLYRPRKQALSNIEVDGLPAQARLGNNLTYLIRVSGRRNGFLRAHSDILS